MIALRVLSRRGFLSQTAGVGAAVMAGSLPIAIPNAATVETSEDSDPWQIGCYTRPWATHDYRTALDAIADAGMKYVGLMTANTPSGLVLSLKSTVDDAHGVGKEAKNRGLTISSLYAGEVESQTRNSAVTALRHLIDLSAAADARTVLMGGIGKSEQYDAFFDAIADCCDYAGQNKVGLVIKPHGGLNATGPQLRKAVEKVNHKNFTVWYDAGNVLFYSDGKIDPVADATSLDGLVTGWCIKDYRHPGQVDVTPGDGQVDFQAVFAQLKKGGFSRGPLIIETLASGDLSQLLAEAKRARQFVETMVRR
jgi:sugar phosphate isomerase/epimerase